MATLAINTVTAAPVTAAPVTPIRAVAADFSGPTVIKGGTAPTATVRATRTDTLEFYVYAYTIANPAASDNDIGKAVARRRGKDTGNLKAYTGAARLVAAIVSGAFGDLSAYKL